jgi:hypothetical protein
VIATRKESNMAEDNRKDETAPEKSSEAPAGESTVESQADGGNGANKRRQFLTAGFGVLAAGATVAAGATAAAATSGRRASKSRILARIEEELDKEYLNDPLTYTTTGFNQYVKGS